MTKYFEFDDANQSIDILNPETPRPWINYLGNGRLRAFISQNAGGLLWYLEPYTRRITRYHYTALPADHPGFYVYIRDHKTGKIWNPHFAPVFNTLDYFCASHRPGITSFTGVKDEIKVTVRYGIPPGDDVMLWDVEIQNIGKGTRSIETASYMEFGLLEFMREIIGWCYLKNQFSLSYDRGKDAILYNYHVFEAPDCPAMAFTCTAKPTGWECSRDAFAGKSGSLNNPGSLRPGKTLSNSELPMGGHACSTLGAEFQIEQGETARLAYIFMLAPDWEAIDVLLERYKNQSLVESSFNDITSFWQKRLSVMQVETSDRSVNRFINTWNPYNCFTALENARSISTDHMGNCAMRYRDTTQDALAVSYIDADFAVQSMREVLCRQKRDGRGCMTFYPHTGRPATDNPERSDNTVWPVYTVKAIIDETGNLDFLDEVIPYRDGGKASVYEHLLKGLEYIFERRGPNGLPTMFDVDWNDGLALFGDREAETVMLGQQLVHSCNEFHEIACRMGRPLDAEWCKNTAFLLTEKLNSEAVWDGKWYRRLILSNGNYIGTSDSKQGRIFLNPQSWSVISGTGNFQKRGLTAMDSAYELLNTPYGLTILTPPYKGFPEPGDPPKGANPGAGENGSIFCHANTWAIIAECLLGNGNRAFEYYWKLLPESIINEAGADHYEREPYAYVSSIFGPGNENFGKGGISWLTGTASWMYIAATQYILGVRPSYDGLIVKPCLPERIKHIKIKRRFRGCDFEIDVINSGQKQQSLETKDASVTGQTLLIDKGTKKCRVECIC